jgi:2-oxoglutarate ferredoxin oxidoreductase subunit gamma
MFAGQLLSYAAMDAGLEVTWIPSYGPEMRGGTAHCTVVISDRPIGSPLIQNPGIGIAFNIPSFDKYEPMIAPGGLLAYNSSIVERETHRDDITVLAVPASEIADEIGNMRLLNMVMLGAVLAVKPVLSIDDIKSALSHHIPSHRRNMLDINYEAVDRGVMFVQSIAV